MLPESRNIILLSGLGYHSRYGLDGLEIEARWGARLFAPVQTGPGGHSASYTMGAGFLSRPVNRQGRGVGHLTPSRAEVKERVELYLYSPLRAVMSCSRVNFNCSFEDVCPSGKGNM